MKRSEFVTKVCDMWSEDGFCINMNNLTEYEIDRILQHMESLGMLPPDCIDDVYVKDMTKFQYKIFKDPDTWDNPLLCHVWEPESED